MLEESLTQLIERIKALAGLYPNRGARADEIAAAERRLGRPFPSDLTLFVSSMNGSDNPTPTDQGWVTFWPIQRWQIVATLSDTSSYPTAIVFADHCDESWLYAFVPGPGDRGDAVVKIDGPDCLVAESLAAFLDAVLCDDVAIYSGQV